MKVKRTQRGFRLVEFIDRYGAKCSLQKSSIATEDCVWLGPDEANPQILVAGQGWKPIPLPEDAVCHTRMHLTQKQVKDLLPHLKKFVETGEI